jgi:hypothetical protein
MGKILSYCGLICLLLIGVCACASVGTSPARDSLAKVYTSFIGVNEATGRNDGKQVEAFQAVTGNRKGDAWCASFVAACLRWSKLTTWRNGNGAARSWFKAADVVYDRNVHGVKNFVKLAAKRGNTGSLFYAKLNRIGHIFFIENMSRDGQYVITVEGNTNNGLSREGDGVYSLRRRVRNIYSVSDHVKK